MDDKPTTQNMINERREYFRVEDKVQLRYLCVDESSALAHVVPADFGEDIGYSLIRELQRIDRENSQYLRTIAEESRELELYLRSLNKKIELIASRIAATTDSLDHKEQQVISLSEGGMAFQARKELAHGCHLALQLTLQPSHLTLVLFGRVINCSLANGEPGKGFNVAVSFINMQEEDRQTIAKHIMQVQLAQRRQQQDD